MTPIPESLHGTTAGYARHRRRHEKPCDACRAVNNAYSRDYKRGRYERQPRTRDLYVDEVAVERRANGDRSVKLNTAEQAEAVRLLMRQGMSKGAIERTTGINPHRALKWAEAA